VTNTPSPSADLARPSPAVVAPPLRGAHPSATKGVTVMIVLHSGIVLRAAAVAVALGAALPAGPPAATPGRRSACSA